MRVIFVCVAFLSTILMGCEAGVNSTPDCPADITMDPCRQTFEDWLKLQNWLELCPDDNNVFGCMLTQKDNNCTADNTLSQFNNLFENYFYSLELACEYNINETCRTVINCYDSVVQFTGSGVYAFYDFFCGANNVPGLFNCLDEKANSCPETLKLYANSFVIVTRDRTIYQADLENTTKDQCPKLRDEDVGCINSKEEELTGCNLSPTIDVPQGNLTCANTDVSARCVTNICGSRVASFYTHMFNFLQCGQIAIDECATNVAQCDTNAECTNTVGSYECSCGSGFEGDGFTCTSIDECATNVAQCDTNAECTNTVGSYECSCGSGFEGDGFTCTSIDECATNVAQCDTNAECTNTVGSYECSCGSGFEGDGFTCTSTDECATNFEQCDSNAQCINTANGYTCACLSGFEGDGFTCTRIPEWGDWQAWGECSVSCGTGFRERRRFCNFQEGSTTDIGCSGSNIQTDICNEGCTSSVPQWSDWEAWGTCSASCGLGIRVRTRLCTFPEGSDTISSCFGDSTQSEDCITVCADPQWSDWQAWGTCSASCGQGVRVRTRLCMFPEGSDTSRSCSGQRSQSEGCINECIGPQWSDWKAWGTCSVSCGQGVRVRTRLCTFPEASNTGSSCSGVRSQNDDCNTLCLVCSPLEDKYGSWPETDVGELITRPCLKSYETGTIKRLCRNDGTWDMVQNECKIENLYLGSLEDQVDDVLNKTEVDSVSIIENVTGTLEDITKEGDQFDNDSQIIQYTISIADKVNQVALETDDVSDDITDNVVGTLSNIIDNEFEDQWNKERVTKGSQLLETTEVILATTTDIKCNELNDNEIIGIDKEHIYAEIGRKSSEVTFPNIEMTEESGIIIPSETLSNLGLSTVCYNGAVFTPDFDFVEQDVLINGTVELFKSTSKINSAILSVQLAYQGTVKNLIPPVRVTHRILDNTQQYPVCIFWDFDITGGGRNGAWSTEGCNVTSYNDTHVECSCDHLTNFAILMSPSSVSVRHTEILSIVSAVGCGISIICLLLTVILHCMLWRLVRSDRAVVLMNLCVALLLALTIFLAGVNRTESRNACIVIAALIQLFFLAVFFFMLLIGLEILICVVHVFMTKFRIKILIPLAWFIPVLIVGISLGVTETKGFGNDQFCWLDVESGLIWAFIGPAAFIILVNFIVILIVFKKMASSHVVKSKSIKVKVQTGLRSICVLVPVMGLTWFMGILSVNSDMVVFQYLFCMFNTLQGLFIFLFHCVFNRQIRDALKHRSERKRSLQTFSSDWRKQTRSGSAVY